MKRLLLLGLCAFAACEHAPPGVGGPEPLGPKNGTLPRRLTYSTGDDRHPAVVGDLLVYSRLDPDEQGNERCLAFLPVEGGTIAREVCPGPPRTPGDTFVDTWMEPALSPDGARIAYLWQQGSLIGVLGFHSTRVVVAPALTPEDTSGFVWPIHYITPAGRIADVVRQIRWLDDHTLCFLLGYEFIFKVKGGGLERYTDTTFESFGLATLDLTTGVLTPPTGAGVDVLADAAAPDGGTWLVRTDRPERLLHLAAGADSATTVGDYSGPVLWLTAISGLPVALVGEATVEWFDPGATSPRSLNLSPATGPVRRLAEASGTRRFVAEIERGEDLFGDPANLWLFELP